MYSNTKSHNKSLFSYSSDQISEQDIPKNYKTFINKLSQLYDLPSNHLDELYNKIKFSFFNEDVSLKNNRLENDTNPEMKSIEDYTELLVINHNKLKQLVRIVDQKLDNPNFHVPLIKSSQFVQPINEKHKQMSRSQLIQNKMMQMQNKMVTIIENIKEDIVFRSKMGTQQEITNKYGEINNFHSKTVGNSYHSETPTEVNKSAHFCQKKIDYQMTKERMCEAKEVVSREFLNSPEKKSFITQKQITPLKTSFQKFPNMKEQQQSLDYKEVHHEINIKKPEQIVPFKNQESQRKNPTTFSFQSKENNSQIDEQICKNIASTIKNKIKKVQIHTQNSFTLSKQSINPSILQKNFTLSDINERTDEQSSQNRFSSQKTTHKKLQNFQSSKLIPKNNFFSQLSKHGLKNRKQFIENIRNTQSVSSKAQTPIHSVPKLQSSFRLEKENHLDVTCKPFTRRNNIQNNFKKAEESKKNILPKEKNSIVNMKPNPQNLIPNKMMQQQRQMSLNLPRKNINIHKNPLDVRTNRSIDVGKFYQKQTKRIPVTFSEQNIRSTIPMNINPNPLQKFKSQPQQVQHIQHHQPITPIRRYYSQPKVAKEQVRIQHNFITPAQNHLNSNRYLHQSQPRFAYQPNLNFQQKNSNNIQKIHRQVPFSEKKSLKKIILKPEIQNNRAYIINRNRAPELISSRVNELTQQTKNDSESSRISTFKNQEVNFKNYLNNQGLSSNVDSFVFPQKNRKQLQKIIEMSQGSIQNSMRMQFNDSFLESSKMTKNSGKVGSENFRDSNSGKLRKKGINVTSRAYHSHFHGNAD